MKITALSSQNYASQNFKNSKVSAQSSKAQQYFADSVSFSGKLPRLSATTKLRAGLAGLAATLLAGGFTAGAITANAATKEQTAIVSEYESNFDSYGKDAPELPSLKNESTTVSKKEKKEIKEQIEKVQNKIVKNETTINKIRDNQMKLEFLKNAKTSTTYSYTSFVDGKTTKNPYVDYFHFVETSKHDPYCQGCSDHFYNERIKFLDEQIAEATDEDFIAELEAQKAEETAKHEEEKAAHAQYKAEVALKAKAMEREADAKTTELIKETEAKLSKLQGSANTLKDKIKELKAANKKLVAKLERLYAKISEPVIYPEVPTFEVPAPTTPVVKF